MGLFAKVITSALSIVTCAVWTLSSPPPAVFAQVNVPAPSVWRTCPDDQAFDGNEYPTHPENQKDIESACTSICVKVVASV